MMARSSGLGVLMISVKTLKNMVVHICTPQTLLQPELPSASSILGMSRCFSAMSKARFRLPRGSSYIKKQFHCRVMLDLKCHHTDLCALADASHSLLTYRTCTCFTRSFYPETALTGKRHVSLQNGASSHCHEFRCIRAAA